MDLGVLAFFCVLIVCFHIHGLSVFLVVRVPDLVFQVFVALSEQFIFIQDLLVILGYYF